MKVHHQRALRALITGSLLVPLAGLTTGSALADGEQTPPGPQPIREACAGVPAAYEPFTDVEGNQFKEAILCLAYAKVTQGGAGGAPANRYVPEGEVRRDAMASFVVRLMDAADASDSGSSVRALPPYDGTPSFSDIRGNTHEATISRLADAGIVKGGPGSAPDDRYVPSGDVTRAQMASFLDRALEYLIGKPVTTTDDYYTDDRGDVHEQSINDISSVGIAAGRTPGSYAPLGLVDRDNMAAFLARTLGELGERGAIGAVRGEAITVTPDDTTPGRLALANPDEGIPTDDRTYEIAGLVPGQEYRITVVDATTTKQREDGQTMFTAEQGTSLAAVGPKRTADITSVNGAAPENNTGDGTARTRNAAGDSGTAVFTAGENGRAGFVLDLDKGGELVLPVVYRNGGPGNTPSDGGRSPRLELGADGVPVEAYDVGGGFRAE